MPTAIQTPPSVPAAAVSLLFKSDPQTSNTTSIQKPSDDPQAVYLHNLALQIKHNLEHQHHWTDLQIHTETFTTDKPSDRTAVRTKHVPPRPLISGLPPTRLYMHPEEQIALLTKRSKKPSSTAASTSVSVAAPTTNATANTTANGTADANVTANATGTAADDHSAEQTNELSALMGSVKPEREWVLPSQLNEKWSLRRFGEVFDAVDHVPPPPPAPSQGNGTGSGEGDKDRGDEEVEDDDEEKNPWRTLKRVLLATVDTDSTIAYYLIHDGIVKPRQN